MQHATVRTTRKKTRKPPPVAADEQTTIRTSPARPAVALTGDRTRLVRVVIAPGSPSGKTPPEPLRLAMALPVAEFTRKHVDGTPITVQQRISWKRIGGSAREGVVVDGSAREGVVVDGSAVHAAVIAACKEYEIDVVQTAAEPDGRYVILRDAVLMRLPPDAPDAVVFDQRAVETIGIPVMGRRGGKWVRWRGGIVAKIKPQYLCDLFARSTAAPQKAEQPPVVAPVVAPVEPPEPAEVRVWISEREWDRLDADTRTEFEEPIGGSGVDWEGREGWVTALVPDDEVLVALRGIAEGAEVKLCVGEEMPAAPVKAARGRKAKAPTAAAIAPTAPKVATHRAQPHPCDAETRPGHGATIAAWQEVDGGVVASVRTKGTSDGAWFEHVQALAARHRTVRVYSAAGECTWDSRDGGELVKAKAVKVKLHRQQPVPEADELAQRGVHVYAAHVEGEWTRVERKAGETAPDWEARYRSEAAQGVRVRVYDGAPRCTWDSLDGAP